MTSVARDGRVVASFGRDAVVADDSGRRIHCRLLGRRLAVVCGDRVQWTAARTEGGTGVIVRVLPRRTVLARMNLHGEAEVVAANLSLLVAVLAPVPAPDFGLCDRYLAAEREVYRGLGYPVVPSSKRTTDGIDALAAALAGEVAVLVGQSGVGKSSLINRLAPGAGAAVDELPSSSGAGRHTTSASAQFALPAGGELVDSPGVRDFAPPLPRLSAPPGARLRGDAGVRGRQAVAAAAGELPRPAGSRGKDGAARAAQAMSWRPASACASVPPSTYSSSPPTGTPCAMRVARMPRRSTSSPR